MIIIGTEVFKTKKALQEKTRSILWAYKPGHNLSPEHFNFILALLRNHEHADAKIGPGIIGIMVLNDEFGSQGFRAVRVDGKLVPFSYQSCITKKAPGADFKNACRREIAGQILEAKDLAFCSTTQIPCPITGEIVTSTTCHVDHEPPHTFEAILAAFVAERQIDITQVKVFNRGVGNKALVDTALADRWRQFHRLKAKLRIVSKRANLSDIRKAAQ